MAYSRVNKYRKGPYKSKAAVGRYKKNTSWYNRKYTPMQVAKAAWRGVRYIKTLVNVEKKFFDVVQTPGGNYMAWQVINLSNIPEGDDYNQRQGNSILAQSLLFRINMLMNLGATVLGNQVRYLIVCDNDQRGVDPTAAELFENTTAGPVSIISPLNHTVASRFNVMIDKTVKLNSTTNSNEEREHFLKYNRHIKFKDTSGADTACYEGNLYLFICSDATTFAPTCTWYSRLRYTDN